jgi:hypothetical protein
MLSTTWASHRCKNDPRIESIVLVDEKTFRKAPDVECTIPRARAALAHIT